MKGENFPKRKTFLMEVETFPTEKETKYIPKKRKEGHRC